MEKLEDCLLKYEPLKEIYKGNVMSTNNEIAIIFNILLIALAASTEIYVDGTFSVSIFLLHYIYIKMIFVIVYLYIIKCTLLFFV